MSKFPNNLPEGDRTILAQMRQIIVDNDPAVIEKSGGAMGSDGITFQQEGVFKYSLVKGKNHYTFHSMVMYANPDIYQLTQEQLVPIKLKKGCFNFKKPDALSLEAFTEVVKASAAKDFSPVIEHYKKKQK